MNMGEMIDQREQIQIKSLNISCFGNDDEKRIEYRESGGKKRKLRDKGGNRDWS